MHFSALSTLSNLVKIKVQRLSWRHGASQDDLQDKAISTVGPSDQC